MYWDICRQRRMLAVEAQNATCFVWHRSSYLCEDGSVRVYIRLKYKRSTILRQTWLFVTQSVLPSLF